MIWLTWRQHRKQALYTLIGLALLAAVMIPTGLSMRHTFVEYGLPDCVSKQTNETFIQPIGETCGAAMHRFENAYNTLMFVGILFLVLPLLVGLFWGAPLVAREVEHGTHRLVWTQGVSRRQWALVKFGTVGLVTIVASVIYGLGMSWWLTPLTETGMGRMWPLIFDMQGLAPIGYSLFAVALGIFGGTVWPKMLPAMATALGGFIALRILLAVFARSRYLPPETVTYPVAFGRLQRNEWRGDWVVASGVRDAAGNLVLSNAEVACPPAMEQCGANAGIGAGAYNWQLIQPAGRFWLFQGIETGIFAALAVILLYLAVRRIRRIA
jgi:hypothetical protein